MYVRIGRLGRFKPRKPLIVMRSSAMQALLMLSDRQFAVNEALCFLRKVGLNLPSERMKFADRLRKAELNDCDC